MKRRRVSTERLLRKLATLADDEDLRAFFADIRVREDQDLLLLSAAAERTPTATPQDFTAVIVAKLSAIVAPASEKADMLIDELALEVGAINVRPKGLAPTIRKLAALFGEDKVEAAADALMRRLRDWGSTRERVT